MITKTDLEFFKAELDRESGWVNMILTNRPADARIVCCSWGRNGLDGERQACAAGSGPWMETAGHGWPCVKDAGAGAGPFVPTRPAVRFRRPTCGQSTPVESSGRVPQLGQRFFCGRWPGLTSDHQTHHGG